MTDEPVRAQRLVNDTTEEALDIEVYLDALAMFLTDNSFEPPTTVGILGGRTGKSYALHLLRYRLRDIRAKPITDPEYFPYVGHPYVVSFNAWGHDQSTLLSGLVRALLEQLGWHMSLERVLVRELGLSPMTDSAIWGCLPDPTTGSFEASRRFLSPREQGAVASFYGVSLPKDDALWPALRKLRSSEFEELSTASAELDNASARLAAATVKIREQLDAYKSGSAPPDLVRRQMKIATEKLRLRSMQR